MPNQKQRKKKHGENKSKKAQAMRTKEAVAGSAEAVAENPQVQEAGVEVSQESFLGLTATVSATTPADAPVRRGFLRQLLSRFSSGQE